MYTGKWNVKMHELDMKHAEGAVREYLVNLFKADIDDGESYIGEVEIGGVKFDNVEEATEFGTEKIIENVESTYKEQKKQVEDINKKYLSKIPVYPVIKFGLVWKF